MPTENGPFDLMNTYVTLAPGGAARTVEGGDAFWMALGSRTKLPDDVADKEARLISAFVVDEDWESWEAHPVGEELVYVISGAIDLVLEMPGGENVVTLKAQTGYLVPRGVFHTANAREKSVVLHVTPGAGTQKRPRVR